MARGELKAVGDHTAAGVSLCAFISQGARRSTNNKYLQITDILNVIRGGWGYVGRGVKRDRGI